MPTLAAQLESVQDMIAEIESGAQSASSEGESVTRPTLDVLYKREERLQNKIDREGHGVASVAEFT